MEQNNVAQLLPSKGQVVTTTEPDIDLGDDFTQDAAADVMKEALGKIQDTRDNSPETYMKRWVQGTEAMIATMDRRRQEYIDGIKAAYQVELDKANSEVAVATKLMEDAMAVAKTQGERIQEITRLNAARANEVEKLVNAAETTFSKMMAGQKQAIEIAVAKEET